MRVQHNIASMNSYRNYGNNTKSINKNLEKLSSGYKINRAGDDAAGLAISEKMRAQITGLEGAQKNAKDGISLVQTAEGALTEVHSMLNRMYTLAEQSANGTYDKSLDRQQLQKEVEQLRTEIDRIADSSNFNGIPLLDGQLKIRKDAEAEVALDMPKAIKTEFGEWKDDSAVSGTDVAKAAIRRSVTDALAGVHITLSATKGAEGVNSLSEGYTLTLSKTGSTTVTDTADATDAQLDLGDYFLQWNKGLVEVYGKGSDGKIDTDTKYGHFNNTLALESDVTKWNAGYVANDSDKTALKDITLKIDLFGKSDGLTLQIGDTADSYNQLNVSVNSVKTYHLGKDTASGREDSVATVDISTQTGAADAMAVIKAAINNVSDIRGTLGATQNRLEHTINNLSVMQENIQDAESTIRDTDVADEMMKYTKNSILVQSAQAMLAQANQQPQGVLQLLQ